MGILVPLWVVCFALSLRSTLLEIGVSPIYVRSPAHSAGYPTVSFVWLPSLDLEVGDRLLRLGETDLKGIGTVRFMGVFGRETRGMGGALEDNMANRVPVIFERHGSRHEILIPAASWVLRIAPILLPSFFCFLVGVLVLWRAPPSPTVRAVAYALLWTALALGSHAYSNPVDAWFSYAAVTLSWALIGPLSLRAFLLFPEGRPSPGAWARLLPWVFIVWGPLHASDVFGWPFPGMGERLGQGVTVVFFTTLLVIVTRGYMASDLVGRRQLKWLVYGVYAAVLPVVLVLGAWLLGVAPEWLFRMSAATLVFIPLALLVAVLRYDLWDIDRLLSATASYNMLLVLLGGAVLVIVPRLAMEVSGLLGIEQWAGQFVASLLLAAIVVPWHQRLRPQIERVFFKERYALDRGIAELLPALSACADARALTQRAGEGLHRLLRTDLCVVYALVGGGYAPVFVEGRAVPPAFEAASPFVSRLRSRRIPLALIESGRRRSQKDLDPFDRAALESLQAEAVVPIRRGEALAAFLCLGPKGSGDIYTPTDLSLLAAVAETLSLQLNRFDQEETIREGHVMQESLRRYVPGAIADQLSSGGDLDSAEREVTVLFVDIRGYTSFSERRRPADIFSTVNRYTRTVSEIVHRHGGAVVEFNGDGMMVVFGAPRDLARKEVAAVHAAREISARVSEIVVEGDSGDSTTLSVGIGIATGAAFVGNIQAVDRMIWSAIGNTTNLAARLQSLTRDLGADVVVDAATWKNLGSAGSDFQKHEEIPIRGRRDVHDVYALHAPGDPSIPYVPAVDPAVDPSVDPPTA